MNSYQVKLQDKQELAQGTMAFHFEKPHGFNYLPGQYNDWKITQVPKSQFETGIRSFSIASAPCEDFLMLATRIRPESAFKQTLKSLPIGTTIEFSGPLGDFVFPQLTELTQLTSLPLVLLAGGIGITPARSMSLQATNEHDPRQIYLFSVNRNLQEAPFFAEMKQIQNPNFHFIPVMTQDESWTGEKGHLNETILLKYLKNLKSPIFYVTGPENFVKSLRQILEKAGVEDEKLKTDEFFGY